MSRGNGFTLVELAIALMVIGLLIGGVLKGQELIQNARVTQTIRQVDAYKTAIMIFRSTYGGLPGDFRHPSRIPGCTTSPCNTPGSGNNILEPLNGSQSWTGLPNHHTFFATQPEVRNFWRHMFLAGLITGVVAENGTGTASWGVEYPASPFEGVGFFASSVNWQAQNGLSLVPEGGDRPAFHARVALAIDTKMDDGKPYYSGDVRVIDDHYTGRTWASNCTPHSSPGEYNVAASAGGCSLYFLLDD